MFSRISSGIEKILDPTEKYSVWKREFEKIERKKSPNVFRRTVLYLSGVFGAAMICGVSVIAMERAFYFIDRQSSASSYERLKEEERERRINRVVERAKLLRMDDKKLSTEKLHEKYIYRFDEMGRVVCRMPEEYRTVAFLFGDSIAQSIIAWSNYFNIGPGVVVAILCAENGSSDDSCILNTVGAKFMENPRLADRTVSRSDARGIAQIKPSTAEMTINKLVEERRWPFQTKDVSKVLSDYDMSIFLLCALLQEIKTAGYSDIKDIAGIYHSGLNGWGRKKAIGENDDEVWKHIKKAQLALQQYEGLRAYLKEPTRNE